MEKQICSVLALILFLDLTDSLTLTVPKEVTGLLRKSVTVPCTYRPSAQYTNVVVTWYINRNDILISRDETGDYIPRSINRDRISINQHPGDVSLVVKNLAYSDRGTYTCEVKWLFVDGSNKMQRSSGVNLIVVRGYPSTTSPVILFPQVLPPSADSPTLTVPEEVTGFLRKSVTIPCTYRPSAQYTNVVVTWYINRNDILISRDETGDYIPRSINRDRISINQHPGDVSLVVKNLAYSDRGTYTCEVKWLFVTGLSKMKKSSGVKLIVERALPSTRAPASLTSNPVSALPSTRAPVSLTTNPISALLSTRPAASLTSNPISALPSTRAPVSLTTNPVSALPSTRAPVSLTTNPISGFKNVKIPAWVFVLTIIFIVLFFSAIIIFILCRRRTKTEHIYEFTSLRYENFLHQEPGNLASSESNEYESMIKMRPNGFQMESACASG